MNYFATQLTEELDLLKQPRHVVAELFGVHQSNLSQFASGQMKIGEKQLAKILRNISEPAALRLAVAWLKDRVPRDVPAEKISIGLNTISLREEPSKWPDTDSALQAAVANIVRKANRHREVRETILSFEKAMTAPGI
jgi:hypothetical protein